ncbi:unnamed protein product [Mycetohabitans rhizoxinica HKI 454]|uniref:Uncharacterized protein n=1 Tax=Mycetohabitans rhizoxinica (strain DSM 19002 / CIP 109453 / HKI 454) TaxID=882378 RepID=E5ALX4_MYCRK|nr:unnamed protein product [Mycetohabitans rhizoxinica HKI 454]
MAKLPHARVAHAHSHNGTVFRIGPQNPFFALTFGPTYIRQKPHQAAYPPLSKPSRNPRRSFDSDHAIASSAVRL